MSLWKPIISQIEPRTGTEFYHFILGKIFKEFKFHVQYFFSKLFDVLSLITFLYSSSPSWWQPFLYLTKMWLPPEIVLEEMIGIQLFGVFL